MSALEDRKLLMTWARLQLAIVIANAPPEIGRAVYPLLPGQPDHGSEDRITKTSGYKKLRLWFLHLSRGARARARTWMRHIIDGTKQALEAAEASGDFAGLKGIEIDYIDTTGAPLPSLTITNQEQENDDNGGSGQAEARNEADDEGSSRPTDR